VTCAGGHTAPVVERDRTEEPGGERPEPEPRSRAVAPRPSQVPQDIRDVSFHPSVRGYARREVDSYVELVNRVIAELEINRSPESAVRHALDRVGEQTSGILQRARATADEIIHTARSEAEESTARARAEAGDIVDQAREEAGRIVGEAEATVARGRSDASEIVAEAKKEAEQIVARADAQAAEVRAREEQRLEELRLRAEDEMRTLRADTDAIDEERGRILDEVHELAVRLKEIVESSHETVEPEPVTAADPGPASEDHPQARPDGSA
jgi:DivIVA domain-containing protein